MLKIENGKVKRTGLLALTEGLKLLARLDEPIPEIHRKQLGHFGRNQLLSLTELLAAARANAD